MEQRGHMDSGHYSNYSNSHARPEQQDRRPGGSRQYSSSSVTSHGQHQQGNHYQPNHSLAPGQDMPNTTGFRQNSSSSLMSQGRNQTGDRYQPNYAQIPNQDPHHELLRQTSQHSSRSQSQHLRPGVAPTSVGQPLYAQNVPRRVASTGRYPLTEPEQQRAMRQQQMAQSMPEGLAEEHVSILIRQGFSTGLAKALVENKLNFHHRVWVVDNSGSMQIGDGHRVNDGKVVQVTRWAEIQDTVLYHSQMAAVLNSFTKFRLLNYPGQEVGQKEFSVGGLGANVDHDIQNARRVMTRTKPDGVTPLTEHIWEIAAEVRQMLPQLEKYGKKIAVILATDGLPTDAQGYGSDEITRDFVRALKDLEALPIWLVIRLCTDEDDVTKFYNKLDEELELNLEVLDDFLGECQEVRKQNPWLNYALPLHRCRELGYHDRLFDLIDERPLTKGELQEFCGLLFGTEPRAVPDPVMDWSGFLKYVEAHLRREQEQWNPLTNSRKPWVSLKKLNKIYGGGACSLM